MISNKEITLVVLAAGMGSRYGGLKQLDTFGPGGESIIDYSIYDAINAGFDKVVFIVRESFQSRFSEIFGTKLEGKMKVAYVNQELDQLPEGYAIPLDRQKPWGTGHAMLAAAKEIDGPFCIINGDDFYGRQAFEQMYKFLNDDGDDISDSIYSMIGFKIKNTLSKFGSVSRGVCEVDDNGYLLEILETHNVEELDSGEVICVRNNHKEILPNSTIISMNMWGAYPSILSQTEKEFKQFLDNAIDIPKSEFYIPLVIDNMINKKLAKVRVLFSDDKWFGVTYAEDKDEVKSRLRELIQSGQYPEKLWDV